MAIRIASRLVLLLGGLALATALIVGALSLLASAAPAEATLLERDHAVAVQHAIEAQVDGEDAPDTTSTSTPPVALVFAGIVLLAALPPVHRIYVYHRSDWT